MSVKTEFTVQMILNKKVGEYPEVVILEWVHDGIVLPITGDVLLVPEYGWGGEKPKRIFYGVYSGTLTVELRDQVFHERQEYTDALTLFKVAGWRRSRANPAEQ